MTTPSAKTRPGWLTAVAITAMALGIMRIGWVVSMLALPRLLAFETKMLHGVNGGELGDLQRQTMERLAALSTAYVDANLGLMLGVVLLAVVLIVGGVGCLKLRPRFRLVALVGFLGLMTTDAALASGEVRYQSAAKDESAHLMNRTLELTAQGGNGAVRTVSSFSKSMETTGLYVTIGWIALRVVVSAGGFAYLARASTKRLFEPSVT